MPTKKQTTIYYLYNKTERFIVKYSKECHPQFRSRKVFRTLALCLPRTLALWLACGSCIFTLSEILATSRVQGSRYPARKTIWIQTFCDTAIFAANIIRIQRRVFTYIIRG